MTARKIFETQINEERVGHLYGKEIGDKEIYVDGAWGFIFINGVCKINLFTTAPTEDEKVERREVAVRLSMSLPTFLELKTFIDKQTEGMVEKGILEPMQKKEGEPTP